MKENRPGRQPKKVSYSFLKIMTGSDLAIRRLPVMRTWSEEDGPSVWLTGCAHGDEVGGVVVIQEIFKLLRKSPLLRGSISAFPLMNPMGFESASRSMAPGDEDLNRCFPGSARGSLAERIADRIFQTIISAEPDLALDLHNDWVRSIPYALLDPPFSEAGKKARTKASELAMASGLLVIDEAQGDEKRSELARSLSGSLINRGVPALTLELGESHVVNEKNVEDGVRAIVNALARLGMTAPLEGQFNFKVPDAFRGKRLAYTHEPRAGSSGLIRFRARPGQIVKKGQKIAAIHNVFGKRQETLAAPADAIVLGHADSSVALPGVPVMAFATAIE